MLQYIFKLLLIPLIVAVVVYAILHLQTVLVHKVINIESSNKHRKKLNFIGSVIAFFGTLCLVGMQTWLS